MLWHVHFFPGHVLTPRRRHGERHRFPTRYMVYSAGVPGWMWFWVGGGWLQPHIMSCLQPNMCAREGWLSFSCKWVFKKLYLVADDNMRGYMHIGIVSRALIEFFENTDKRIRYYHFRWLLPCMHYSTYTYHLTTQPTLCFSVRSRAFQNAGDPPL